MNFKSIMALAALLPVWHASAGSVNYRIAFPQSHYDVPGLQEFQIPIRINPLPAAGLFSYGLITTVEGDNGLVGIVTMTPLKGLSDVATHFLQDGQLLESDDRFAALQPVPRVFTVVLVRAEHDAAHGARVSADGAAEVEHGREGRIGEHAAEVEQEGTDTARVHDQSFRFQNSGLSMP